MKGKKKNNAVVTALLAALGIETSEKVAAAPPAELKGKAALINGVAAPDGVYTVVGGVVTAMESVEEEASEDAPASDAAPAATAAKTGAEKPLTKAEIVALIKGAKEEDDDEEDPIEKLGKILATAITGAQTANGRSQKTSHVPIGFKPENKAKDAVEWDRSFKANEHTAMKRDNPERWTQLFYAKYGRMPN